MDFLEDLESVDEFLEQIEAKYSPNCDISFKNDIEKQIYLLSEEFETLGLPSIDIKQSKTKLLHQIVSNTFLLIQLHRKSLSEISDLNVNSNFQDIKNHDLEKVIVDFKRKVNIQDSQIKKFENKMNKLSNENLALKKIVDVHTEETNKMRLYFKTKQNELTHQINRLKTENDHLKEICGKDVDKYNKDDKFLKIIKKYKQNQETYKSALQKLEENNAEIVNEILNLKEELALAYSRKQH